MNDFTTLVLHVEKSIRRDCAELIHVQEIEELAVAYAESRLGSLRQAKTVVVGTGKIGKAVISVLPPGANTVWIYRNNPPVAPPDHIQPVPLENLLQEIDTTDVVIFATASETPLINRETVSALQPDRRRILIDLGIPRNVEKQVFPSDSPNEIMDLDDIKHWHRRERCDTVKIFATAEEVARKHWEKYDAFVKNLKGEDSNENIKDQ